MSQAYLRAASRREELRQAVLAAMADQRLDALAYATFDYPPPKIPSDVMTRTVVDTAGPGNNRRLSPADRIPRDDRARRIHGRWSAGRARVHGPGIRRSDSVPARVCLRAGDASPQAARNNARARDRALTITKASDRHLMLEADLAAFARGLLHRETNFHRRKAPFAAVKRRFAGEDRGVKLVDHFAARNLGGRGPARIARASSP